MNHSNAQIDGLDIWSKPGTDGVGISIPGEGSRTVIFTRDSSSLAAVTINGNKASKPLKVIELIIRYMRHCEKPNKNTKNKSEIVLLNND